MGPNNGLEWSAHVDKLGIMIVFLLFNKCIVFWDTDVLVCGSLSQTFLDYYYKEIVVKSIIIIVDMYIEKR